MIWHSNLESIIKVLLDRATPTTYPSSVAASNQTRCSPQSLSYVPSDPLQKHSLTPVLMNEKNKVNNFRWNLTPNPFFFWHVWHGLSLICEDLSVHVTFYLTWPSSRWCWLVATWRGEAPFQTDVAVWRGNHETSVAVLTGQWQRMDWDDGGERRWRHQGSGLFYSHRGGVLSDWTIIKMKAHHPPSKSLHYFPSKQYILPDMKGHHDGEIFPRLFPICSSKDLRQFSIKIYVYSQVVAIAR